MKNVRCKGSDGMLARQQTLQLSRHKCCLGMMGPYGEEWRCQAAA